LPAAVLRAEKEIALTLLRGGEPHEVVVPLDGPPVELGVSWREDDAEPGAVFITRVVPYSPAARAGLAVHDRIYGLNGEPLANGEALLARVRELLAEPAETLSLEVETAGHIRTVDVDLRLPQGERDRSL
jgi:S1-C subfamily serine protease